MSDKKKDEVKTEKPAILDVEKQEQSGQRVDSCAGCAGKKFC